MEHIIYNDEKNVKDLIWNINKDWFENMYVLADFDRTLTYALIDGEKKPSLISVIRNNPKYLGQEYSTKANALFDYYYPIEIEVNIPMEEKIPKISEWWRAHLSLLVESWLNKKHINEAVNSGIIKMRSGVVEFLKSLDEHHIPLIILSANGLWWDSIWDYLKYNNLYTSNIEIVSNKFEFDNEGNTIWYDSNVIHVFNKWEVAFSSFPEVEEKIKNRANIVLLGDSLWDPHMADGGEYDNLLKIWFYNETDDKKIPHYLEKYDMLLTWDSDGDFLNNIFK